MEKLVLITCPRCGYMINGRLWRCPGCGGADINDTSGVSRESQPEYKSIITTLGARIKKIF